MLKPAVRLNLCGLCKCRSLCPSNIKRGYLHLSSIPVDLVPDRKNRRPSLQVAYATCLMRRVVAKCSRDESSNVGQARRQEELAKGLCKLVN